MEPNNYYVSANIRPDSSYFWVAAIFDTLFAGGFMAVAVLTGFLENETPGSAAPLLLSLLSISLAFLIQQNEHPILKRLLLPMRVILLGVVGSTLAAVVCLIVGLPTTAVSWVWVLSSSINVMCAGLLVVVFGRVHFAYEDVSAESDISERRPVMVL